MEEQLTEYGVSTESNVSPESGVSPESDVSPISECSLDIDSISISPTSTVSPVCLHSMSIIKRDLRDRLNRLTLYTPVAMATACESKSSDILYANTASSGPDSMEGQT